MGASLLRVGELDARGSKGKLCFQQNRRAAGIVGQRNPEVRVLQLRAILKDAHFWVSLANDSSRTPVLLEAEVPFGTARVELTHAQ